MLLKTGAMTDSVYDPTLHFTQNELMEKFNLAFYEGQNLSKGDIVATFDEPEIKDDYLIDYLISNNDFSTPDFDFTDFVKTFDENLSASIDTETTNSSDNYPTTDLNFSQFFVPPSLQSLDNLDLSDIDLCETLSNESLNLRDLDDIQDLDEVTVNKQDLLMKNIDFNAFLRNLPDDNLSYPGNDSIKNEFGHLLGIKCSNNNISNFEDTYAHDFSENHIVLTQNEALLNLNDDPLLSSTSLAFPRRRQIISESESSNCDEEVSSSMTLQCQWEDCYKIYDSQNSLVKHIEKTHVEVKRGEEFTCFWENCPRKVKPFNARYKLLIHMRVHSGEKPNKCPFEGCNKAFSRLENLKIHQRSHTGERPYLCQFPTCTKSFSNSSDRAKHQRTHFDTKPYACQVVGCTKKYTDPSSLRKHVKNHTNEEQMLLKKRTNEDYFNSAYARKFYDPNRQKAVKNEKKNFYTTLEHNYSNNTPIEEHKKYDSCNIKQDLKNKISEKNKLKKLMY